MDAEKALSQAPTNVEKLRGLPWGVAWNVANAVFAQLTFYGSLFVLFLNQLGLDKAQIGGLLSLLPFLNVVALFIASPLARIGYKRVFASSMATRTLIAALLLLAPAVLAQFGIQVVLAFVTLTVAGFGLFRAIGFTAFYPWLQEQVTDAMRGKYTAVKNTLASLATFLAMIAAGYVLGPNPVLHRFLIMIGVGVVLGLVSVWAATRIPGGAPAPRNPAEQSSYREMVTAARDPNLISYLIGVGLVTLSTGALISFVPLFMKEQVGLSSNRVVWLDTGILLGGLASSYLWGWLADRYGSKPVMISGVYLLPLMPLAWLLMPRYSSLSLYVALAIAVAEGFVNTGWNISSGRILFTRVVPVEKRGAYTAFYYAWMGIAGGLGQLLGGWLVSLMGGLEGRWWIFKVDPYTPLFLLGVAFPLISYLLLKRVRADSQVTTREFAGMFVRGNPLLAMESLVRYHRARDEREAIAMTERLGSTRSPLTVEELLEALHDPRFFVRFEAIVSIARHGATPHLTDALIDTLEGNEPALGTLAAWALGRIGGERALDALRRGLNARYRSVQAHCARSLGSLGDRTVLPLLLDRLAVEDDVGLQMAFAAALGQLGAAEATGPLLSLLRKSGSQDARAEFTLALARLAGEEHRFVQLQRRVESEAGTSFSRAVTALRGKLSRTQHSSAEIERTLDAAADALAQDDLSAGMDLLCSALRLLPPDDLGARHGALVRECVDRLEEFGLQRIEYAVLALHALDCGLSGGT
jgi:MFS family permease